MKRFTALLLMLSVSVSFSQTIDQQLSWGQEIQLTLPTTTNQTYATIALHAASVVTVPRGVNLTISGQVQGGKIIFLGNNVIKIGGDINGGKIEIGEYSSVEIKGNINNNPQLTFLGYNTLNANNISAGTITLNGNTCIRTNQLEMSVKFIGNGQNNNVNYNVPAHWGYKFSAENVSFSNNTNLRCEIPLPCTPPANIQTYGTNEWNGYVYSYEGNETKFETAKYLGTLKEDTNFDRNMAGGAVDGKAGTRNIPCVTPPSDKFMVRYKQKIQLDKGIYNFSVGGDDGYRLSIDGGKTWIINNWTDHSYTTTATRIELEGAKEMVLEYYENGGDARISFSYWKVMGDPKDFGQGQWYVYGYNNHDGFKEQTTIPASYSGYYIQDALGVDSRDRDINGWDQEKSPSHSNGWQGTTIPDNNFSVIHKRQGFPCGKYQIKMSNWDDKAILFLDGVEIWKSDNYNPGSETLKTIYALNENSKMELRLQEDSGHAGIKMELIHMVSVVRNASDIDVKSLTGSAIRVESNVVLKENLEVCSCEIVDGSTLTILENITLTIQNGLIVEKTAKKNSNLVLKNNGSLVQVNDMAKNSGAITVKRHTAPVIVTDYTYWSSPVGSGFTLYDLSPKTPATKFYEWDPLKGWKLLKGGKFEMEAGKGYIVRAPENMGKGELKIYEGTFEGEPNNGHITQKIAPNRDNLIGNPYPSAISADDLYMANNEVISGTFHFWTHNTPVSDKNNGNHKYNYAAEDYASYNLTGGVKTLAGASGGKIPTGKIASGQSFFIMGTEKGGELQFNNAMRIKGENAQFFRGTSGEVFQKNNAKFEKHRFWLNISNDTGSFNEALVGYVSTATNGLDAAFDGVSISSGNALIYSLVEDQNLVIQGRALPFSDLDTVPLGIKIGTAGAYTINMDQFDGLFLNQDIYLFDHFTNTFHDLKASDYNFTTEKGTFDNRFEIRYITDTVLGTDEVSFMENDVMVYAKNNMITVNSPKKSIKKMEVYDLIGRTLYSKTDDNNATKASASMTVSSQVVIVKIQFENNTSLVKKVLLN